MFSGKCILHSSVKSLPILIPKMKNNIEIEYKKSFSPGQEFSKNIEQKPYTYPMMNTSTHLFDPTKNSPPNEFLQKLHKRFKSYDHLHHVEMDRSRK